MQWLKNNVLLAASITHTNETTSDILNKQTKVYRSFLEHQQSHFQCRNMKLKKFPPPLSSHSLVWTKWETSKDLLPHTDEANSQLPALTASSGMLQHLPTGSASQQISITLFWKTQKRFIVTIPNAISATSAALLLPQKSFEPLFGRRRHCILQKTTQNNSQTNPTTNK